MPGDILLVNLIDESDGLFTNFTAEANYSYHSALYLEIEYEGKFFPVIYEAYEKGARIVPLITFVQPSYTGFIEILRWKNQDSVNRSVLSQAVLAYLELPHCFNLTLNDEVQGKSNYITCTTTFTRIIEKAGLPVPVHLSEISDPVLKNMESLKLFGKPFLTPTDFLYFAELKPTGIIDNGQFPLILAASLINNEYNMWLSHYSLNPTADPDYRFYLRAARAIIEGRGALLLKLFGYTEETFPYGTPETLAFILRLEEELEISVSIMRRYIESFPEIYISQESFSLQSSLANEALMVKVRDAMKRMETHFNM
ncbi:MAG: hypothetical protein E4H36_14105 [Spirochaetales bacterium]|nr:MAG: hypothetical protein E4H36_14105 [Spirochaetales bacterium]